MNFKKLIIGLFFSCVILFNSYADFGGGGGGGSSGPTLVKYTDSLTSVNNLNDTAFSSYPITLLGVYDNGSENEKASVTLTASNGLLKFHNVTSNGNTYYRTIYFNGNLTITTSGCSPTVTKSNGSPQSITSGYQIQNGDKVVVNFSEGSSSFTYSFIKDTTPPQITSQSKQYYNLSNKTFSFTANDTGVGIDSSLYKIKCSALGIDKNTNSTELSTTTTDGNYEVIYSASDYLRNKKEQKITITFDKTNPVVTFSKKPGQICNVATIQASVSDANPDKIYYYYTYNNKEEGPKSCNGVVTLNQPGEYSNFYFTAIDKVGNEGRSPKISFTVDTAVPVITVNSYTKDWTNSSVEVTASASDNYGYDYSSWKYSIDNGTKTSISLSQSFEKVFDLTTGIHEIYLYVSDKAGNEAKSEKITLKVDKTKPTTPVITNSCNSSWTNANSVTVSAKSEDSHSGISHYLYSFDNKNWNKAGSVTVTEECNKTVYFKSVDKAGNESDVSSSKIMIDRTKPKSPVLTNSCKEAWTNAASVTVAASATDNASGISHYLYSFDNKNWNKAGSVTITEECNKFVYFKSVDYAGNESEVTKSKIKIDRTKPVINNINYSSAGVKLNENELIIQSFANGKFKAIVNLDISADDKYGNLNSESILKFKWQVYQGEESNNYVVENTNKFSTEGFLQDKNYILVIAIDEAGNESEPVIYGLLNDNIIPNAPIFNRATATHKFATTKEDAASYKDASFDIYTSKNSKYGIKGIVYSLYKFNINGNTYTVYGDTTEINNILIETNNSANISFDNLDDNEEDEFYSLSVKTIGKNGVTSNSTEYIFRVDTTPPENYIVYLRPQIDSNTWYGSTYSEIHWVEKRDALNPKEKTGVQKYEYRIIPSDCTDKESIEFITIEDTSKSFIPVELPGSCKVEMRFTDFAGNIAGNTDNDRISAAVKIDTLAPVYNGNPITAEITKDNEIKINWGKFTDDNGSGVNRIEFTFTELSNENSDNIVYYSISDSEIQSYNKNKNSISLDLGFEKEKSYLITVSCYDNVGNKLDNTVIAEGENFNEIKTLTLTLPFESEYNNFKFNGKADFSPLDKSYSNFTGDLLLPISIEYKDEISGDLVNTQLVSVDNSEFAANEIVEAYSKKVEGNYKVNFSNEVFYCETIGYTKQNGLVFNNITYSQSIVSNKNSATKDFLFNSEDKYCATAGFVPMLNLSTNTNSEIANPVVIKEESTDFVINGVTSLAFSNGIKNIGGNLSTKSNKFKLYKKLEDSDQNIILLYNANNYAKLNNFSADVDCNNLYLDLNEIEYKVLDAEIVNSFVKILSAQAKITINNQEYLFELHNFVIDESNGTVNNSNLSITVYDSDGNKVDTISDDSVSVDINSIYIDQYGNLISDNAAHVNLGYLAKLIIAKDGFDYKNVSLNDIGINLYGYSIEAKSISFKSDRVIINEGFVTIYDDKFAFNNLNLNPDCTYALSECAVTGDFTKDVTRKYHNESTYSNLIFKEDGLYATITVPVKDDNQAIYWTFENAYLNAVADEGCFVEDYVSRKFTYGSYEITADNVVFDGAKIIIKSGSINLSKQFFVINEEKINSVNFNNLIINFTDVIDCGKIINSDITYKVDGWNYIITNESLRIGNSLIADGFIVNTNDNDFLILGFKDFKIFSNDIIESGISINSENENENIFVKNQYFYNIYDAEFTQKNNEYVLRVKNFSNTIYTDVEVPLHFTNVDIKADMTIDGEYAEEQSITFTSANEYIITTDSALLNDDGILINGSLSNETLKSNSHFENNEIQLSPDFIVTAESENETITYEYAGWQITGRGVTYDYQAITIKENKVRFNDAEIELGELKYNRDFELINSSVLEQKIPTTFLSQAGEIQVTRFTSDGLNVRAKVILPSPFNNNPIVFDTVYLEQDGNFYVKTVTEEKSFPLGSVEFKFKNITIGSKGLFVETFDISVTNPEPFVISMRGLQITNEGHVLVNGSSVTPFKFLGMTYCIENFALKEDGIYFKGYTYLPDTLPGTLAGMCIAVNDFYINYDATVYRLDIKAKGDHAVPITNDWTLTFSEIGVEADNGKFELVFEKCGLIFPQAFKVQEVEITDVRYDLLSQHFVFDSIKAKTDIPFSVSGINLTLKTLQVKSDWSFGFGGTATFDSSYPEFLRNCTTEAFVMFGPKDGIQEIRISAENLNGRIHDDITILELRNGHIKVEKETNSSLYISIGGGLYFTDQAPEGMQNAEIGIKEFTYDGASHSIKALSAYGKNFPLEICGVKFKDNFAEVEWTGGSSGYVSLGGTLVMPESMPDGIKGSEININKFKISFDGNVEFDAAYKNDGPINAYGGLILSKIDVGIGFVDKAPKFNLAGQVLLDEKKFPSGLGGLKSNIALRLNGNGLEYAYAAFDVKPGTVLFNTFTVNSFNFVFEATSTQSIEFTVSNGSFTLPGESKLPQGLANAQINIRKMRMNSKGELLDFDVGAQLSNIVLFNAVQLNNPKIDIISSGINNNNDFDFSIGGSVKLIAASLPNELKNTEFKINTLKFSTQKGIKEFNVGLNGSVDFTILNGLQVSLKKLNISDSGFSCAATATMNYEGPMKGTSFALTNLAFNWNFKITDVQGGLEYTSINIAGFNGTIKKLYFVKDATASGGFYIALDECKVTLPANAGSMGGKSLGLKNAIFRNGKFEGAFIVPSIEIDIVGFKLTFDNPQLDFKKCEIAFDKVGMKMPEALKSASIGLNGVSISASNGLCFKGGAFRLPDFKISDGVGFEGLYVDFTLNGSQYEITGEGGLSLANCGTMFASVSFTNISKTYPIGLKRAFFSFEAKTGGIPLGNTGLQLSGIRGGLAYGEPNEVPASMRYLFGNDGIRIQLGLTMTDINSNGQLLQMKPDTWIDVKNLAFAFSGQVFVLKGKFDLSAQADAGLSRYGFYTGLAFTLKVVKGNIEFYVFDQNGVKFSGRGSCQFGLQKGALFSTSFKILWKRFYINIPTSDIWLAKIGAEFGYFGSAGNGFKAYSSFLGFGSFGIFVSGKGNIKFGNVSSYTLVTPKGSVSNENYFKNVGNLNAVNDFRITDKAYNVLGNINLNNIDYEYDDSFEDEKTHTFVVNGKSNPGITLDKNQIVVSNKDAVTRGNVNLFNNVTRQKVEVTEKESGLDRIIFVCSYAEGNPEFYAVSPSGKTYSTNDKDVETNYFENCVTFIINNPEAGEWEVKADNIDEDTYSIDLLTVETENFVTITEPSWNKKKAEDKLLVKGKSNRANSKVHVYAAESKDAALFELATITTDSNGNYEEYISTENIFDGEYYLAVKGESSTGELSPATYSDKTYLIDRSKLKLLPPANFLVAEREQLSEASLQDYLSILTVWENTNGNRTLGYKLKVVENGETNEINVGNIKSYRISNLKPAADLYVSVCAYGENGLVSEYTEPVHIIVNSEKTNINEPVVLNKNINIKTSIGAIASDVIKLNINNYSETGSIQDYLRGRISEINNTEDADNTYFNIKIGDFIKIQSNEIDLPVTVTIAENCPIGEYTIKAAIVNEGNKDLISEFTIELVVDYPELKISSIEPETLDGSMASKLFIYGEGFVDGSRYYFDGNEISVDSSEALSINQQCLNIPACYSRGEKELKVINPNGNELVYKVNVVYPDWTAYALVDSVIIKAGETAVVPVNVEALDGYTGFVSMEAVNTPAGINVEIPELPLDTISNISISSSKEIEAGEYNIILNGNNGHDLSIPLTVLEADKVQVPYISQIAPYSAFVGDKVTIYGYGFGESGHLMFNKNEVSTDEWTSTSITFTVTNKMESGILYIVKDDIHSNATRLNIHERGFTIKCNESDITLERNISKTIPLYINGYAKKVELEINIDPSAPFKAELTNNKVVPNGMTNLVITGDKDALNGKWNLAVIGNAGSYTSSKTITVSIGDSMEIDISELYKGKVGVPYKAQLYANNSIGVVDYSIAKGSLPSGLKLSSNGVISGTPYEQCEKSITIHAVDSEGQIAEMNIEFTIIDDSWATTAKNSGFTRSTTSEMPSTDSIEWNIETKNENADLIVSDQNVLTFNSSLIKAYADNGKFNWKLDEDVLKIQATSDNILLLSKANILYALDKKYGTVFWQRTGVINFTTSENIIITEEKNGYIMLNSTDGLVVEINVLNDINLNNCIWVGNVLYEIHNNIMTCRYGNKGSIEFENTIMKVSADSEGFVVVTKNGIYSVDSELNIINYIKKEITEDSIVLTGISEDGIFVQIDSLLSEYVRTSLKLIWTESDVKNFAIAHEKVVVLKTNEIKVLNRYNGKMIWNKSGLYNSLALYGENIYAATLNGELIKFNGIPNATAPVTSVIVEPEKPNGNNGWYNVTPKVSVISEDAETYVESIQVSYDEQQWTEYECEKLLNDGYSVISAYGVDSKNFRGETDTVSVKVDTVKPVSQYEISNHSLVNEWISEGVEISLSASDDLSGLSEIVCNESTYSSPITISDEGIHPISWYAVDYAGNKEDVHSFNIMIDKYEPTTGINVRYANGICVVYLNAEDSGSGIDRIEYSINGNERIVYTQPVVILKEGKNTFEWEAFDVSGKTSGIRKSTLNVNKNSYANSVIALPELNGKAQNIGYPFNYGSMYLKYDFKDWSEVYPDFWQKAYFNAIPEYLLNGDYILWNGKDMHVEGNRVIDWFIKKNAVMYMYTSKAVVLDEKWILVDSNAHIQDAVHPEGFCLYMRRGTAGEEITVNIDSSVEDLPLIVVKPYSNVKTEIKLDRTPCWDDIYYNGRKLYRSGVQVVLNSIVNPSRPESDLPVTRSWTYEMNGVEKELPGLWYTIPEVQKDTELTFRFKIVSADGIVESCSEEKILIEVPDNPEDLYPWNKR